MPRILLFFWSTHPDMDPPVTKPQFLRPSECILINPCQRATWIISSITSRACPRIEPNKNQNRANPTPMPRTFTRFVCAPPTHMLPPLTHQPTRHRNTQHRTRLLCCVEFCLPTRDPSDFAWNFIAFRQDGRRPQCSSASRGKERGGSNGHGQKGRGWRAVRDQEMECRVHVSGGGGEQRGPAGLGRRSTHCVDFARRAHPPSFLDYCWRAHRRWSWDICADTCAICRNSLYLLEATIHTFF